MKIQFVFLVLALTSFVSAQNNKQGQQSGQNNKVTGSAAAANPNTRFFGSLASAFNTALHGAGFHAGHQQFIPAQVSPVQPIAPIIPPIVNHIVTPAPPSTCRYWCRTPQGQAYCCENINQQQSFVGVVKQGYCPPVRPVCPPVRSFQPPASCSNDGACGGYDKCCFDTCLQQHICKPPLGLGK